VSIVTKLQYSYRSAPFFDVFSQGTISKRKSNLSTFWMALQISTLSNLGLLSCQECCTKSVMKISYTLANKMGTSGFLKVHVRVALH